MAEFQSTKCFYFYNTGKSEMSYFSGKRESNEWRFELDFEGSPTTRWQAKLYRSSGGQVRVTGGGLMISLPTQPLPIKAVCFKKLTDGYPICLSPPALSITDEKVVIACSVHYFQPFENSDVIVNAKPPLEPQLWSQASAAYEELFLNGTDADITFVVGNQEIPAHRVLLAARVPYFSKMMSFKMMSSDVEPRNKKVEVDIGDAESFKRLLKYVYCGQLPDDLESYAVKLLALADRIGLSELKEACVHAISKGLTRENVCETLVAADLYRCPDLKKKCLQFLCQWRSTKDGELLDVLSDFPKLLVELLRMRSSTVDYSNTLLSFAAPATSPVAGVIYLASLSLFLVFVNCWFNKWFVL